MKILLVHNFYGSSAPSGENIVFEAEKRLLVEAGHEVIEYSRHSDEIRQQGAWGAVKGALSTPWNAFSYAAVQRLVALERPAVMHVHNTFPLLSPAIFHAAGKSTTTTVLTLHNYRTVCAAAIPMRLGRPCTECIDRQSVIPALRYGCYRESRLATLPLAVSIALHRRLGTWQMHVDAFIALTEFQRDLLIKAGLPAERIFIKPHFYRDPPSPIAWEQREAKVIFVGRLGEEKGVRFLLEAWRQWGEQAPQLELMGDGPQREELQRLAQGMGRRVNFSGQLPFAETQARLARARLLVLPSLCFEGFPMVIREAFALGVPVAASRLGSMACLVRDNQTGGLFEPADAASLASCVQQLWQNQDRLGRMAGAARHEFESNYTEEANHQRLMEIYQAAIENQRKNTVKVKA